MADPMARFLLPPGRNEGAPLTLRVHQVGEGHRGHLQGPEGAEVTPRGSPGEGQPQLCSHSHSHSHSKQMLHSVNGGWGETHDCSCPTCPPFLQAFWPAWLGG